MPTARPPLVLLLCRPIVVAALAATAIPFELHWPPHLWTLDVPGPAEVVANVLGYLPIGIVLAPLGTVRSIASAALLSMVAESAQTIIVHRDPSVVDALANAAGAILGVLLARLLPAYVTRARIGASRGALAALAAVVVGATIWSTSGYPLNSRGVTEPGILEAHWPLDDADGPVAHDTGSGHLDGIYPASHGAVSGRLGSAVAMTGTDQGIAVSAATAFRLTGSMTVSAWINPSSFPADDAVIASTFDHVPGFALGWQLDTTVDQGPRTAGFKLADECGEIVARYGATPLQAGTWYHVAGVYDADHGELTIYLNGLADNGFLLGRIPSQHRSSRQPAMIGGRHDRSGFEFAGAIDDVRVYSFALTAAQVTGVMHGTDVGVQTGAPRAPLPAPRRECQWLSEPADARMPGAVALVGILVALACAGLTSTPRPLPILASSVLAGIVLVPFTAQTLPAAKIWIIPLTSLSGGVAVSTSLRRAGEDEARDYW